MPRLIFKCPYPKPDQPRSDVHRENYVRYVATREGVDRLDSGKAALPATERQKEMVRQLLRDFPLCRGLFEYEDYLAAPTCGNASEFITRAIEDNADSLAKRENYVDYIAKRPRAERSGAHGLFTGADDPLVLSQVAEAVASHPGNVWLHIISLRREDAARLGYDNAANWKQLLTSYAPQFAKAMKIPLSQFRWYAAFHDESHHPHVHMVYYRTDGKSGFLDKGGIARIKSGLAREIFRQDLTEIYQRQTWQRDALTLESQDVLRQLIDQMRSGTLESPSIERLMLELAERLKNTSGKKRYGYLKAPPDFEKARLLLLEEAQAGNALAMFDLGRISSVGIGQAPDEPQAQAWYAKALAAFRAVEKERSNRYAEYRIGRMYAAGPPGTSLPLSVGSR